MGVGTSGAGRDVSGSGGDRAGGARDASEAAAGVVHALRDRGQTLAAVESLTGGLLAATIVDIAGASRVFRGGLVCYATGLKATLAGVPAGLLAERGPVDPDVAVALAEGGRQRCRADWALAVTGVAGPEPQAGQPVGRVFVALAGPGVTRVCRLDLTGNRIEIRTGAVTAALGLLVDRLHADARPV
jgi:nicotinamide-nucleotide amidase